MLRRVGVYGCVVVAVLTSGCATTLSTMTTADVADVGQVQASGGTGLFLNLGPFGTIIDQAIKQGKAIRDAEKNNEPYTVEEEAQQQLLTAAIAIAVMPPGQGYEVAVRTGIWDKKMDLGLRYSVNAFRLDGRYQLLEHQDPETIEPLKRKSYHLALGVGVSKYLFDSPVIDALEYVQLGDFSRWDFEVPLYASVEFGEIIRIYGAAKYLYSVTTLDARLVNYSQQATNISGLDVSLPSTVHMHFVGSTVGVMAGYKYVYAVMEVTGGYLFANPYIAGEKRQLGGPTIYPSIGLAVEFP